jgi:hypothetical protein
VNPLLLPQVDPSPLPGPAWLFHALLLLTFFVHVLCMNLTLGAGVIGAAHLLPPLARKPERRQRMREAMTALLPVGVSLTITTGVAPLLFVQVVYGQLFYPATILIGWAWVAIPALLILAYAAVYVVKLRPETPGGAGWATAIALGLLAVAAVHVTANLLQLTPARWAAVASGQVSALGDATWLPRLLHFVLGGLALGGLAIAGLASRRRHSGSEWGWLARIGVRWALAATALQMADGFWFLFSLPVDVLRSLLAGRAPATPLLAVAMGLAFLTLMLLARLDRPLEQRGLLHGAAAALLLTILGMVMLRDAVRDLYLQPIPMPGPASADTQLGPILLFLAALLSGLGTLAWIGRRVLRDRRAGMGRADRR